MGQCTLGWMMVRWIVVLWLRGPTNSLSEDMRALSAAVLPSAIDIAC